MPDPTAITPCGASRRNRRTAAPRTALLRLMLVLAVLLSPWAAEAARLVRVGVYENRPMLFTGEDGVARGVYVDLLAEIARAEDWQLQFRPGAWNENLDRLERGEIDVLPDIGYSAERAERYDFSGESVFSTWALLYVHQDSDIQSYQDLEGKTVAVLRNDVHYPPLKSMLESFDVKVRFVEHADYDALFTALVDRSADAALMSRIAGMVNERRFRVKRSPMILNPIRVHFAFPQGRNADLREAIDEHLVRMKQSPNSALNRSLAKWLPETRSNWFPHWAMWTLVLGAGALVMALLVALLLRAEVRRKTRELAANNTSLEREVAERRRAEEALRESEERYRAVFQTALDPLVVMDTQGRILAWNRQATRTFGWEADEILGKGFDTLFDPGRPRMGTTTWQRLAGPQGITAQRVELNAVRRDGTLLPVEVAVSPAHLQSRQIVCAFIRDLSERQAAHEARTRLLAMESELEVARTIQQTILPRGDATIAGRAEFSIHAEMIPAREVGGDFYDYFMVDDRMLGVVVGDVSGKGVPAAILMAAGRAMLRSAAMRGVSPADVLRHVNNLLEESTSPQMFVSAFYGVIDLRSGLIEYCSGGHEAPIVLRADGGTARLAASKGMALGVQRDEEYTNAATRLGHGDTVFLYTDGVTEAMDEERAMFGEERLVATLKTLAGTTGTPGALVGALLAEVHGFTGGAAQSDDITTLAVRYR